MRGGDAYIKASTGEPPPVFLDSFVAKVTFLMHTKTWTTSAMSCYRLDMLLRVNMMTFRVVIYRLISRLI